MKKLSLILVFVLLLASLSGCFIKTTQSGFTAKAESYPVEDALEAVLAGDEEAFRACLHPDMNWENCQAGFRALQSALVGQAITELRCAGINVTNYKGSNGNSETAAMKFLVATDAGTWLVDAIYETTANGSGFTQFLLEMGIVR